MIKGNVNMNLFVKQSCDLWDFSTGACPISLRAYKVLMCRSLHTPKTFFQVIIFFSRQICWMKSWNSNKLKGRTAINGPFLLILSKIKSIFDIFKAVIKWRNFYYSHSFNVWEALPTRIISIAVNNSACWPNLTCKDEV